MIRIHAEALREIEEAHAWYAARSVRVASRFLEAVFDGLALIQERPQGWEVGPHGERKYVLKGFPYVVIFRVAEGEVQVFTVGHGRRRPGYWLGRLPKPPP